MDITETQVFHKRPLHFQLYPSLNKLFASYWSSTAATTRGTKLPTQYALQTIQFEFLHRVNEINSRYSQRLSTLSFKIDATDSIKSHL